MAAFREQMDSFDKTMAEATITPDPIEEPVMKIGSKEVEEAAEILRKYKEGKAHLEKKLIEQEQFWKLRQWSMYDTEKKTRKPATAWLWSCIQSRYADVMDSYPTCNFQPRQEDDKEEAKKLSSIVPVILEQNRYEETYSDIAWYMLKHGGCVQGVFWDKSKHNGLGDIAVKKIDFINLFWEPGITDIQESENVFTTELVSNKLLEQMHPQCAGKLGGKKITLAKYIYDDSVDTTDKSVVVDWYYHTAYKGKRTLQYVKFVDNIVLYASENDTERPTHEEIDPLNGLPIVVESPSRAERGWYDHGLYPFVVQALYPIEGSICGYGLTDIGRDTQMQIDVINDAVTRNAALGAKPRFFTKNDGGINMKDYTDYDQEFVPVDGPIDELHIRTIETKPLQPAYIDVLNQKVDELKFITSNQDVANGAAPSGVTAASAIAALQETSGKASRASNKAFHRAFREVCYQIIELIRQFYDVPRTFRIVPDSMGEQFVQYSNEGLRLQPQILMGKDMGLRKPEFDIDITSEKASPYKKMEQNELALNFYKQGFFNPQMADQAISCLEMMDFSHKDEMIQRIRQNGTILELMIKFQQIALQLAQKYEPQTADEIANLILGQGGGQMPMGGEVDLSPSGESSHMEKAREQARSSTEVQ